jgi:hypothetical protein
VPLHGADVIQLQGSFPLGRGVDAVRHLLHLGYSGSAQLALPMSITPADVLRAGVREAENRCSQVHPVAHTPSTMRHPTAHFRQMAMWAATGLQAGAVEDVEATASPRLLHLGGGGVDGLPSRKNRV